MEEHFSALVQAFADYRQEAELCQRKQKPTDGLLGFGHSLRDDACHDRFDARVQQAVDALCASQPTPEEAERAVRFLLDRDDLKSWPLACQWMMRAIERHCIPLIPFLKPEDAAVFLREYDARYRRWERRPAQKKVYKARKEKS
ncbi:MAG: hypothetical protein IKR59_00075 [Lachnospiraceae bacterium]|nr:hypothetical protein [Lachnospiraceae bacterium]